MEEKLDAVILAGDNRALTVLNGKPMVQYVIDALSNSSSIGTVYVVGNNLNGKIQNAEAVQSDGSMYENLRIGVQSAKSNKILVSTCDIPLINSGIVDKYIKRCLENNAELYLSMVSKNSAGELAAERAYRIPLKEGNFRIGYLFLFDKSVLENKRAQPVLEELIKNKKADIGNISKFFSLGTKIKFGAMLVSKSLSIDFLEQEFNRIFNCKGKIIISESPEIVMDMDEPIHMTRARKYLEEKA